MKERARRNLNNKVILFPDLEKRLLAKGLESLQQKKHREAVDYLEEALQLDSENHDILIGLVLAYFESGMLLKAKELANEMLQKGIGDYLQVVEIYITILVQLHQYHEIVTTIEVLLEEREISKEKFEHFTRMLQFSRTMEASAPIIEEEKNATTIITKELNLISYKDQEVQIQLVAKLSEINIRPFLDEIRQYLQLEEGDAFFKTMLLNILTEQEYDKEILLEKLNREISVIPAGLKISDPQPQKAKLFQLLEEKLEHEDPILLEQLKGLIERQFFIIYPFQLEPYKDTVWAAAYHSLAAEYQGIPHHLEELAILYNVKDEDLMRAGLVLMKIEEISSPNF